MHKNTEKRTGSCITEHNYLNISTQNLKMKVIIKQSIKNKIHSADDLSRLKRKYAKEYRVNIPTNAQLLKIYKKMIGAGEIKKNRNLEQILKIRAVRSLSGVAVVSVLTKPYPCPGKCLYCPTEKGMPKSYLSNEPAVMRAILNSFHPYKQVKMRLKALKNNGHPIDKIELIVIGGTWSYLPKKYQTWFIKQCFDAANGRKAKSLQQAQKINETAKNRIIGLTLETRPDFINKKEIERMRMLGATRIELGAQSLYDSILYYNHRGHGVKDSIYATKILKEAGFKICYHMMPNLPGSSIKKDLQMFKKLFSNPDFQPDMLKIYPCVVLKEAKLYKLWKQGGYKPYSDKQLANLLADIKKNIPYYVRINRLIRDIPSTSVVAGNKISNLRQILKNNNVVCRCIRCREAGHNKYTNEKIIMFRENYDGSNGQEIFLSFESPDRKILYAFLRLRINSANTLFLKNTVIIRELHTYGQTIPINQKSNAVQHKGLGKKLMTEAEKIVKKEFPRVKKIAVISGVGARQYYGKIGYKLQKTYMVKNL